MKIQPLLVACFATRSSDAGEASRGRAGFGLAEFLLVLLSLGIIAALVLPKFGNVKERAYVTAMKNDLHNYALVEEEYFEKVSAYGYPATMLEEGFVFSEDVSVDSAVVNGQYWYLRVKHAKTDIRCTLDYARSDDIDSANRIICPGWAAEDTTENVSPYADFTYTKEASDSTTNIYVAASGTTGPTGPQTIQNEGGWMTCYWDLGNGESSNNCFESTTVGPGTCSFVDASGNCIRRISLTMTDESGIEYTTTKEIIANEPPEEPDCPGVCVTGTRATGETLTFDGSGSTDPDGHALAFYWEFGDGATASTATATHIYSAPGDFTVSLTVRDAFGATSTKTETITITEPTAKPVAKFSISSASPIINEELTFDASESSDPQGDDLVYIWNFGDGDTATGAVVTHSYPYSGTFQVVLTATDPTGDFGLAYHHLGVGTDNLAPTASFSVSPSTNPIPRGSPTTSVTFDASASDDPEGRAMTYTWTFGDGRSGSGKTVTHEYSMGGNRKVRLLVKDDYGHGAAASKTITIQNNAPTATMTASADTIQVGQSVAFDATGSSDPDGEAVSFHWIFESGETGSGVSPTHTFNTGGTFNVTLIVRDGSGAEDRAHHEVVVLNQAPTVTLAVDDASPAVGQVVTFDASSGVDPDGHALGYTFEFGDGEIATSNTPMAAYSYDADGRYTARVNVSDGHGGTATDDIEIVVGDGNTSPTARFNGNCTGLRCAFTDQSTDPDGAIGSWNWAFGDGQTATTQNPVHQFASAGSYVVHLTVADNQGKTASTQATALVSNAEPIADFTASCTSLDCTFTDTSSDPDGSITSWAWTFGEINANSTEQNPGHTYTGAGAYVVILTVTDNAGATAQRQKTVTVTNQEPTAAIEAACTALDCTFLGDLSSDPDGTIASYSWNFGDGSPLATGVSATHSYATDGTYTVALTVTDEFGASAVATQGVTVEAPAPGFDVTFGVMNMMGEIRWVTAADFEVPGSILDGESLYDVTVSMSSGRVDCLNVDVTVDGQTWPGAWGACGWGSATATAWGNANFIVEPDSVYTFSVEVRTDDGQFLTQNYTTTVRYPPSPEYSLSLLVDDGASIREVPQAAIGSGAYYDGERLGFDIATTDGSEIESVGMGLNGTGMQYVWGNGPALAVSALLWLDLYYGDTQTLEVDVRTTDGRSEYTRYTIHVAPPPPAQFDLTFEISDGVGGVRSYTESEAEGGSYYDVDIMSLIVTPTAGEEVAEVYFWASDGTHTSTWTSGAGPFRWGWMYAPSDRGTVTLDIEVFMANGRSDRRSFTITVESPPAPDFTISFVTPDGTGGHRTYAEGDVESGTYYAGETLYQIVLGAGPSGVSLDGADVLVNGAWIGGWWGSGSSPAPFANLAAGTHTVEVLGYTSDMREDQRAFTITVDP